MRGECVAALPRSAQETMRARVVEADDVAWDFRDGRPSALRFVGGVDISFVKESETVRMERVRVPV